jgi:hypothetical protein
VSLVGVAITLSNIDVHQSIQGLIINHINCV